MKELIEFLMMKLNQSGKFGDAELFNEQAERLRNKETRGRRRRFVTIEPIVNEQYRLSLGINKYDLILKVSIINDNKKHSKTEDLELLDQINDVLQNLVWVEANKFSFSSLVRESFELDSDHDQLSSPFNEYRTMFIDYSGYKYRNFKEATFASIDIQPEIVDSI